METFSIEQAYLGDFHEFVQSDLEDKLEGKGDHPSVHFYDGLAQQTDGPVLELPCGTGRVTLPIVRQGLAITGLDLAPAMVDHARHKADQEGLPVHWGAGEARTCQLSEKFKLIFMTQADLSSITICTPT
jgi:2-polyprenyl-3-methyl-5-hydroxy-6-metoxy-1,4-benzoquinol methylase